MKEAFETMSQYPLLTFCLGCFILALVGVIKNKD